MKTFAIHSPNDAAILIRLHDDLVKEGLKSITDDLPFQSDELENSLWCYERHRNRKVLLFTLSVDNGLTFHNHSCSEDEIHYDLTPDNYDAIFSEIIEAHKGETIDHGLNAGQDAI